MLKKSSTMGTVIAALGSKLSCKVQLVPVKEYNQFLKLIITKGYEIHFGVGPRFIYKARNANEVKRFAAALMDLLDMGLLLPSETLVSEPFNDDVGDLG